MLVTADRVFGGHLYVRNGKIAAISDDGTLALFRRNCVGERRRFSWERMCDRVTELYGSVSGTPER